MLSSSGAGGLVTVQFAGTASRTPGMYIEMYTHNMMCIYIYIYMYLYPYLYLYLYLYLYFYISLSLYIYIYIHTRPALPRDVDVQPLLPSVGKGLMGTQLNGYLVLQGNLNLRTARFEHFPKVLARERLGTRWAKYPCSRCK